MDNQKAAEIIYERLKSAYGGLSNEQLGKEFGVGGQAIYKRKKKGNYDKDEIIAAFPDVNRTWLNADNIKDLQNLEVRQPRLSDSKVQYADSVDIEPGKAVSKEEMKRLLSQIQVAARILKDNL